METPGKPLPVVSVWAKPFWDAAREQRLVIQFCSACSKHIFYPRIACPHCGAADPGWVDASGKGTIYSYTVVENNAPSSFAPDMPFVIAVIRLEEGVQMLSNVVECNPDDIECDMQVEVTFERRNEEFTMPVFRLAEG